MDSIIIPEKVKIHKIYIYIYKRKQQEMLYIYIYIYIYIYGHSTQSSMLYLMLTFPKHTKSHFFQLYQKYQFLRPEILSGYIWV